jgi:hypothetical protein
LNTICGNINRIEIIEYYKVEAVSKGTAFFSPASYPQTPQGGLSKLLDINKSPLGVPIAIGIGMSHRKLNYSTAPIL